MVSLKLLKHSVIVAIDYWLALWTSSKTNLNGSGSDARNGTSLDYSGNTTLPTPASMEADVWDSSQGFTDLGQYLWVKIASYIFLGIEGAN